MVIETKVLKAAADETGALTAVFSTWATPDGAPIFDKPNGDGTRDLMTREAFWPHHGAEVPLIVSHEWQRLAVGKGHVVVENRRAIFDGSFHLKTEASREARAVALEMQGLQEYSYGFSIPQDGTTLLEASDGTVVRRVDAISRIYEVSMVLVGQGTTQTLSVKAQTSAPAGTEPFTEYWDHEIPPDTLAAAQEAVAVAQVRLGLKQTPELVWVAPGVPGKGAIYLEPNAHGWYRWDANRIYVRLTDDLSIVVKTIGHELHHLATARRDQLSDADSAGNHADEASAEAFGERLLASLIHRRFLVG